MKIILKRSSQRSVSFRTGNGAIQQVTEKDGELTRAPSPSCRSGASGTSQETLVYVYPIMWAYLIIAFSTLVTFVTTYAAYRRLTAGTSKSIIAYA